ncbi:MAG: hypothetical protein J6J97_06525, partial [Akkermansia sp.]|nr:hypothetical protein [Akkermansia sp.]
SATLTLRKLLYKFQFTEMRGLLPERFLEGLGFMGTCVSQNKSLGHVWESGPGGVALQLHGIITKGRPLSIRLCEKNRKNIKKSLSGIDLDQRYGIMSLTYACRP